MQLDLLENIMTLCFFGAQGRALYYAFLSLIQQSTSAMQMINKIDQIHGKTVVIYISTNTSG